MFIWKGDGKKERENSLLSVMPRRLLDHDLGLWDSGTAHSDDRGLAPRAVHLWTPCRWSADSGYLAVLRLQGQLPWVHKAILDLVIPSWFLTSAVRPRGGSCVFMTKGDVMLPRAYFGFFTSTYFEVVMENQKWNSNLGPLPQYLFPVSHFSSLYIFIFFPKNKVLGFCFCFIFFEQALK